jgi:methionyl-tRNA formyltransferase
LALAELQPEGKKRMAAADFQRGYRSEFLGEL